MAPRISPEKEALHHVINKCDKTKLDIKFIDAVKGRGLFALGSFAKGEFVAQYRGDFIDCKELERRKRVYHPSCAVFLFEFKWRGKTWCIDASVEDGTFGRIVNDDHIHPNCKMKRIDFEGKPHLCLFTLRDIKEGEELTYDYGGDDCPWREKMTHVTADGTTTGFLEHPDQPQSHMNTSFGNDASQKRMTHVTADGTTRGFLEQSDKPQSHMNTSFGNDSSQKQMTHVTVDGTTTGFLEQSDKPQSHMNTSFGNDASQKQMTHVTADGTTTGFLEQSDKPQSHMNTSFGNDASQKQMTHVTVDGTTTGFLEQSDKPQSHMNTSFGNDASQKQMTHVTADGTTRGFLEQSDKPQSHMNTSFGNDSSQKQMTHVTVDGTTTGFLEQSDKPQSHMNTSFGNDASQKQMTHVKADGTTTGFLEQSDKPQSHINTSFGNDSSQKQMTHVTADGTTTGFLEQSDKPQSHMNTSFGNDASQKQMTHVTVDGTTTGFLEQSDKPQSHMNTSFGNDASQKQMTHVTADGTTRGFLEQSDKPQSHMNTSFGNDSSQKQMTHVTADGTTTGFLEQSDKPQSHMNTSFGNDASQKQILTQPTWEVDSVPKLRRTKSVIMKDTNHFDSDELYDSTTDSSDNYVPDTTSGSESDSDLPLSRNKLRSKFYDELNLDYPDPANNLECDSTTLDNMPSLSAETSAAVEPNSSQATTDIVVKAYNKKGVQRIYDKRHYCFYCSKPYAKMARHLEKSHVDKSDVARAVSFPKGSKERKYQLDYIRNRGNYAHNAAVMESGSGELVPFKRPQKNLQGEDFMHCAYCQGLFTRKVLWRHIRNCRLKPQSVRPKPGKNRVQAMCTYTGPVPLNMTKQLWEVISVMNPGPITDIIKNDCVITEIGQHLLNKGGLSDKNKQCVREKMRELGRLVHNARKVTSLKTLEDCVNPKKYIEIVKAVKYTCGYDSENDKFAIPSLANKLGNSLVKVSRLLKAQGLILNDQQRVKNASEFLEVHQNKWNELVSATALRNIREAHWNVPALMPFTNDVQKLHVFLGQQQDEWFNTLSERPSTKAWIELAKVCLAQMILFNRRREGEVSSMPLTAFLSRDTSDPHNDVDWALSEVEKKLCRHFTRIITRGKRGRPVPILLTPKILNALDLLVNRREDCSILKDNIYLFARPEAMSHLRGSDCLRAFSRLCGAKCPEALTSTKLRKHAATLSTVLNMTDTEMDQLANFLGHDIRIHREFYRLPEKTLQLAKISKVLMALEQGRMSQFQGKNLDEIRIEPDEKVDCEEENDETEEGHSLLTTHENIDSEQEDGDKDGRRFPAIDEPAGMVALASAGHTPPPPKKRKPSEKMSSVGSTLLSSGKGKNQKKCPWQPTEVQAVEKHLKRFITSRIVPTKSDCEKCLKAEPEALINRDWKSIKFYVYNRSVALRKKQ